MTFVAFLGWGVLAWPLLCLCVVLELIWPTFVKRYRLRGKQRPPTISFEEMSHYYQFLKESLLCHRADRKFGRLSLMQLLVRRKGVAVTTKSMRNWLSAHSATILAEADTGEPTHVDLNGLFPYEGELRDMMQRGLGREAMVTALLSRRNVKCSHKTMQT